MKHYISYIKHLFVMLIGTILVNCLIVVPLVIVNVVIASDINPELRTILLFSIAMIWSFIALLTFSTIISHKTGEKVLSLLLGTFIIIGVNIIRYIEWANNLGRWNDRPGVRDLEQAKNLLNNSDIEILPINIKESLLKYLAKHNLTLSYGNLIYGNFLEKNLNSHPTVIILNEFYTEYDFQIFLKELDFYVYHDNDSEDMNMTVGCMFGLKGSNDVIISASKEEVLNGHPFFSHGPKPWGRNSSIYEIL